MKLRLKLQFFVPIMAVLLAACGTDSPTPTPQLRGAQVPTRATPTPTFTATFTSTSTPTATQTPTETLTPTNTPSPTSTLTATATFTSTFTSSPTAIPTNTPTPTAVQATPTTEPTDLPETPDTQGVLSIAYGDTVTGTIDDETPRVAYSFSGSAGDIISISLNRESGDLDPYLRLLDVNDTVLIENDDASGSTGRDSLIAGFELPADGTYTIIATRFQEELGTLVGDFSLTLTSGEVIIAPTPSDLTTSDGSLKYGDTVSGTIDDSAGVINYTFEGSTGDVITITMKVDTGSLDPVLQLLAPDGSVAAENDDATSDTRNSTIEAFTLPESGTYTIVASRFQGELGGTVGDFTLNLESDSAGGSDATIVPETLTTPEVSIAGELPNDGSITGTISAENPFVYYSYAGTAGDLVTFSVAASAGSTLDPLLILLDPKGQEIARNDDPSQFSRDSIIDDITLPETGQYTLLVTRSPRRSGITIGDYLLLNYAGDDTVSVIALMPLTATYNEPVNFALTQQRDEGVVVFKGSAGDEISMNITRTSGNIATFFALTNPAAGIIVASGNEQEGSFTLPVDGYYSLLIVGRRGSGSLTVTVTQD